MKTYEFIKAIAVMAVLALILTVSSRSCNGKVPNYPEKSKKELKKKTSISKYEAKAALETQIENTLKAPSTSEFSGVEETSFQQIKGGYTITGYVDSQNGFGAMIRSHYKCDVIYDAQREVVRFENYELN